GRRDNKYKARVKILVHELGAEEFRRQVEEEFAQIERGELSVPPQELERIAAYFAPPDYDLPDASDLNYHKALKEDAGFARWAERNVAPHRADGHAIVNISLKPVGGIPGDATSAQMRAVADIAERWSKDEIRVSHEQNLVLPHVRKRDVHAVWEALKAAELANANIGLVTDIISCPGLDYCSLATARSIPIAQKISSRLGDPARQREIGDLKIKISGCINACGHHHAGHIGILGLEKRGEEYYQITLGGSGDEKASIGEIIGPGFSSETVTGAVETIIDTYIGLRHDGETFLDAYRRVGAEPFKEAVYAGH
ncbi:MAG: nitrite/sulfite reductase, partial [Hyphomicrobiales bacterium]